MRIAHSKNIAYRVIGGKAFIVDTKNSYLHSLNELGTEIWKLLSKPIEFEDLINNLLNEYDVDRNTLQADLTEFIEELKKKNLLSFYTEEKK
ncbi:MAG: PqqD family protein [Elusimicrobiota bacterium]|nr:PqqD family protein [Elusimicrobiota bacterium]